MCVYMIFTDVIKLGGLCCTVNLSYILSALYIARSTGVYYKLCPLHMHYNKVIKYYEVKHM